MIQAMLARHGVAVDRLGRFVAGADACSAGRATARQWRRNISMKIDVDEDGGRGDDCADALPYLVATKSRTVIQRKLSGL